MEGEDIRIHVFHYVSDIVEQCLLTIVCSGVRQLHTYMHIHTYIHTYIHTACVSTQITPSLLEDHASK